MKTQHKKQGGFTLIELLVVIAIISMLIGLISVGLRKTKIISMNLRQKSVFHAMEIGLELFSKDFDGYPDSSALPTPTDADQVCGAQHLLEALIGRDEEGVEPRTNWYAPDPTLYMPTSNNPLNDPGYYYYDSQNSESLDRRKGPYGEFRHVGIYTISDLWQGINGLSMIYDSQGVVNNPSRLAPVFTDVFRKFRVPDPSGTGTVRVGMPILYFKSDPTASRQFRLDQTAQNEVTNPVQTDMESWTYNYLDNEAVALLPSLEDTALNADHYVDPDDATKTKAQVFYEQITQREDKSRPYFKPFNADTFLLISAGWDGLYGTDDDVTNFNY